MKTIRRDRGCQEEQGTGVATATVINATIVTPRKSLQYPPRFAGSHSRRLSDVDEFPSSALSLVLHNADGNIGVTTLSTHKP